MKKAFLFLFVALGAANQLVAQNNVADPGKIVYTARGDASKPKISINDIKKPVDEDLTLTSDYTKSNTVAVSDLKANQGPAVMSANPSSQAIQLAAEKDAKRFTLSHSMLKKFKKEQFPSTSDYFKPARHHVTNPAMLSDSTYVKTFKYKAYLEAQKAKLHPVGHAIGTAFAVVAAGAIIAAGVYEVNQM